MTQPDLVSKLMEFVRAHNYGYLNPSEEGKPGHYWCLCGWEGPDRSSYWKHLDEALVAESLLGREGQAAPLVCGYWKPGQPWLKCDLPATHGDEPHHWPEPQPSLSTPIVTLKERFVSRDEFNDKIADEAAQSCVDWSNLERRKEALRYIIKQIWNEAITEREASTPIVPGTAEHGMNCPATNPLNEEDCTCGLRWRIELQTEREMHNAWRKRAEEAEQREAQIRKDVLREAFLLRPGLPHDGNSAQFREGYYAGLEAYRQAIRSALKEES